MDELALRTSTAHGRCGADALPPGDASASQQAATTAQRLPPPLSS
jgi:hypothetical protein